MREILIRLRGTVLKRRIEAARLYSDTLFREFEAAELGLEQLTIAREHHKIREQMSALKVALHRLEDRQNQTEAT